MQSNLVSTPFNCVTDYAIESLQSINLGHIRSFFDNLPVDPYLEGGYRHRRLSRFKMSEGKIVQLKHTQLFQSKDYNPLLGDIYREFSELEDDLIHLADFQKILREFFEFCQICSPVNEVGVHQIRTITTPSTIGEPAPEGIHRDGVDLVGIFCVTRANIFGGETSLYKDKAMAPIFTKILHPRELCVFNDHEFYHFTSQVTVVPPAKRGIRDVFVLTCPGLSPPESVA